MDKKTAVDSLRAHVEHWWSFYGNTRNSECIMLVQRRWYRCPLYHDTNRLNSTQLLFIKLRSLSDRYRPSAIAIAALDDFSNGHPMFYMVAVEFADDPQRQSIVWKISEGQLAYMQTIVHEHDEDEPHEMRVFEPSDARPPGWHAGPMYLLNEQSEFAEPLWRMLLFHWFRIIRGE
jgi:hypothetical protein